MKLNTGVQFETSKKLFNIAIYKLLRVYRINFNSEKNLAITVFGGREKPTK